jgi:nicotinate-nucleotide adenylyltransferase
MRLGVMGGTFDPIHHGHLVAASEVQALFHLDEVVFVPTGQPWQKSARKVSPPEHRYLMTVIATASNPRFTVSRVDVDRPGPTFTIDTLRDIQAQRPGAEMFFITGADALAEILSWKDADELFQLAHFIGVTRPGHELSDKGLPVDKVTLQEVPAMAISSTDCRERVERGEPVWYLVPDGVVQYINKHRLYAGSPASAVPSPHPGHPGAGVARPATDPSGIGQDLPAATQASSAAAETSSGVAQPTPRVAPGTVKESSASN